MVISVFTCFVKAFFSAYVNIKFLHFTLNVLNDRSFLHWLLGLSLWATSSSSPINVQSFRICIYHTVTEMATGCLRMMKISIFALDDRKVVLLSYEKIWDPVYLSYIKITILAIIGSQLIHKFEINSPLCLPPSRQATKGNLIFAKASNFFITSVLNLFWSCL